jgi:hypothetical protein
MMLKSKYRNVGPMGLKLLSDTDKSVVNAGMPECRGKVSPASAFLEETLLNSVLFVLALIVF